MKKDRIFEPEEVVYFHWYDSGDERYSRIMEVVEKFSWKMCITDYCNEHNIRFFQEVEYPLGKTLKVIPDVSFDIGPMDLFLDWLEKRKFLKQFEYSSVELRSEFYISDHVTKITKNSPDRIHKSN